MKGTYNTVNFCDSLCQYEGLWELAFGFNAPIQGNVTQGTKVCIYFYSTATIVIKAIGILTLAAVILCPIIQQ